MSRKRPADWEPPTSSSSRQRTEPQRSLPRRKYAKHKDSKVGEDFHSVPYPLCLLPKTSWRGLNQGEADGICSSCGKARHASAHQRKLFLVAERLSWEPGAVSYSARSQNEEALWACNAELGIFDPAVDDDDVVIGGRRSRYDEFYPYQSEADVEFAMRLIANAEVLSETSWTLWKGMVDRMMGLLQESHPPDIASSSIRRSPRKNSKHIIEALPIPLAETSTVSNQMRTCSSFDTLQDFYSLMDKIERTSPMGARFLEAYAERLHNESCESCWFACIATAD